MAKGWIIQSRSAATILLVGLWTLGVGSVTALSWYDEVLELRHPAVLASAVMVVGLFFLSLTLTMARLPLLGIARLAWTLGAAMLLLHIVVAFWRAHGWSHSAAVDHVREVGGFGGGIVVSYVFVLVWSLDTLWWWISPASRASRPRWLGWSINGFLLFIVLNATVIFGDPERRVFYSALFLLPVVVLIGRRLIPRVPQSRIGEDLLPLSRGESGLGGEGTS
jgi:hypothetical protein